MTAAQGTHKGYPYGAHPDVGATLVIVQIVGATLVVAPPCSKAHADVAGAVQDRVEDRRWLGDPGGIVKSMRQAVRR